MADATLLAIIGTVSLTFAVAILVACFWLLDRCKTHIEESRSVLRDSEAIEQRVERLLSNEMRWPS